MFTNPGSGIIRLQHHCSSSFYISASGSYLCRIPLFTLLGIHEKIRQLQFCLRLFGLMTKRFDEIFAVNFLKAKNIETQFFWPFWLIKENIKGQLWNRIEAIYVYNGLQTLVSTIYKVGFQIVTRVSSQQCFSITKWTQGSVHQYLSKQLS